MSTDENKARMRQFFEEVNKGNLASIDEFCAPEAVFHRNTEDITREQLKQYVVGLGTAFTDIHFDLDDMIAEGDKVAERITFRGTHRGVFQGIAPTGKQITYNALEIDRFIDGKIVEAWIVTDTLGMMQQLGAIPQGNI